MLKMLTFRILNFTPPSNYVNQLFCNHINVIKINQQLSASNLIKSIHTWSLKNTLKIEPEKNPSKNKNVLPNIFFFLNITMWAGVPSEPLCLHTQSLATAHQQQKNRVLKMLLFRILHWITTLYIITPAKIFAAENMS
eukprot:TRINITY_DN6705_c0_g2_i1.p5 TRINITY_DN6705_c0_g2~~TRINITY_DN6705_c0_g2_i1.p5  ORF type:complete len:138 (+),score=0.39 TRINITY_DN6705_c0_g2_i1:983-1396(+)